MRAALASKDNNVDLAMLAAQVRTLTATVTAQAVRQAELEAELASCKSLFEQHIKVLDVDLRKQNESMQQLLASTRDQNGVHHAELGVHHAELLRTLDNQFTKTFSMLEDHTRGLQALHARLDECVRIGLRGARKQGLSCVHCVTSLELTKRRVELKAIGGPTVDGGDESVEDVVKALEGVAVTETA